MHMPRPPPEGWGGACVVFGGGSGAPTESQKRRGCRHLYSLTCTSRRCFWLSAKKDSAWCDMPCVAPRGPLQGVSARWGRSTYPEGRATCGAGSTPERIIPTATSPGVGGRPASRPLPASDYGRPRWRQAFPEADRSRLSPLQARLRPRWAGWAFQGGRAQCARTGRLPTSQVRIGRSSNGFDCLETPANLGFLSPS